MRRFDVIGKMFFFFPYIEYGKRWMMCTCMSMLCAMSKPSCLYSWLSAWDDADLVLVKKCDRRGEIYLFCPYASKDSFVYVFWLCSWCSFGEGQDKRRLMECESKGRWGETTRQWVRDGWLMIAGNMGGQLYLYKMIMWWVLRRKSFAFN